MLKRGTIVALVLMAGWLRADPTTQPAGPGATFEQFVAAARAGDIPQMASLLADSDDDKLRQRLQRMSDELVNDAMTLTVVDTIVDADVAAVIVRTSKGDHDRPEAIPVAKMGPDWKLVLKPKNAMIDPDQMTRLDAVLQLARERTRQLREQIAPATQPAPQP